jgi:hypothetical protein
MVLSCVESVEDLVELVLWNAGAGIAYRYLYPSVFHRRRLNHYLASLGSGARHRIHPVRCQVQYHLLKVDRIGSHREKLLASIYTQRYTSLLRLGRKNVRGIQNYLVQVKLLNFELAVALYQLSQVPDDVDGMLIGFANLSKDLFYLVRLR